MTDTELPAFNARAQSRGDIRQLPQPLHLKYPVSANRYWRRAGNMLHLSAEAKAYKAHVAAIAAIARQCVFDGPVAVFIQLQPKLTRKGKASLARMDLDNCIKITLDALNGIAYVDDSQVVRLQAFVGDPVADGGLMVIVRLDGELRGQGGSK